MLSHFFAQTLINTSTWFGAQGYCGDDFAILEARHEITGVEIALRSEYDPAGTATGLEQLPDVAMTFDVLGGSRVDAAAKGNVETNCNVPGFRIVPAKAHENSAPLDLLKEGRIATGSHTPLPLTIDG